MGQYFRAVVLAPKTNKTEIKASFISWDYESGDKQMEHAWRKNPYVMTVESHFIKGGELYMHALVWAGDYAGNEPNKDDNLYHLAREMARKGKCRKLPTTYRYVVNHTKRQFVDKDAVPVNNGWQIHPLPLLTAEGNEDAGGEYHSDYPDHHLIEVWARDIISIEETSPEGYSELKVRFIEKQ